MNLNTLIKVNAILSAVASLFSNRKPARQEQVTAPEDDPNLVQVGDKWGYRTKHGFRSMKPGSTDVWYELGHVNEFCLHKDKDLVLKRGRAASLATTCAFPCEPQKRTDPSVFRNKAAEFLVEVEDPNLVQVDDKWGYRFGDSFVSMKPCSVDVWSVPSNVTKYCLHEDKEYVLKRGRAFSAIRAVTG